MACKRSGAYSGSVRAASRLTGGRAMAETATALVLVICACASALALWRKWSPPLMASLGIGLALRFLVACLAYRHTPVDVAVVFQHVGQTVLRGKDPLTALPKFSWNFLPFSAYLLAFELKTGRSWQAAVKLLPVACDVATIGLAGFFARPSASGNVRLLYALNPVALLVSAWHGQIEPIAITLGLSALLLARRHRALWAGIVLGFAVASKTWPLLFVPGVFRDIRRGRWWQTAVGAVAVLIALLMSSALLLHSGIRHDVALVLGYRAFLGSWGWTGVLRYLHLVGDGLTGPRIVAVQRLGTLITAVTLGAVVLVFRRCSGPDLTVALLLAFLAVTPGFGPQYLIMPAALLCASRRPAGFGYLFLASVYTGVFYLYAFPRGESLTSWPGALLEVCSIAVIIAAIASMPWSQARSGHRTGPLQHQPGDSVSVPALRL
jgi:hypothetical protein